MHTDARRVIRAILLLPIVLLAQAAAIPAARAAPPVVVLYDGLTAADLHSADLPSLRALADRGAQGLMNTALRGPRTRVSAVATLACGALVRADRLDGLALLGREPIEGAPASEVYSRRTGWAPPRETPGAERLLHIGWAGALRSGTAQAAVGPLLSASSAGAPLICGNDDGAAGPSRPAVLFGMDARGVAAAGPVAGAPEEIARAALASPSGAVIDLGAAARSGDRAALERVLRALAPSGRNVIVIAPRAEMAAGKPARRLPIVVAAGPSFVRGLLTSDTTRTAGLIANVDTAPWLIELAGLPRPDASAGHAPSVLFCDDPSAALTRLDTVIARNAGAFLPTLMILGILTAVFIFAGLALRAADRPMARICAPAMVWLMAMPLAMLITPAIEPLAPAGAGWWVVAAIVPATMAAIAAAALAAGYRRSKRAPDTGRTAAESTIRRACVWISSATVLLAVCDAAVGQRLTRFALISSYQIEGIRYYGTGNEYMGLIVGMALLAAFVSRMRVARAVAWLGAVAVALGLPGMGANAGGMVAAVVAAWCAVVVLRGGRVTWRSFVAGSAAGFAAAFAFAWLDQRTGGGHATHMGLALSSARAHGAGSLAAIVIRKIRMNAALLLGQYTTMAVIGVAGAVWLARGILEVPIRRAADRSADWWRGGPAYLCGSLAALLYNDSGIVAALFLSGVFLATGFALLFVLPPGGDAEAG